MRKYSPTTGNEEKEMSLSQLGPLKRPSRLGALPRLDSKGSLIEINRDPFQKKNVLPVLANRLEKKQSPSNPLAMKTYDSTTTTEPSSSPSSLSPVSVSTSAIVSTSASTSASASVPASASAPAPASASASTSTSTSTSASTSALALALASMSTSASTPATAAASTPASAPASTSMSSTSTSVSSTSTPASMSSTSTSTSTSTPASAAAAALGSTPSSMSTSHTPRRPDLNQLVMDAKIDKGNEYNNDQKYENRGNNIRNSPAANILSDTLALPGQIPDSNEDVDSKSGDRTGDTSSEDGDGDLNDSRRLSVSDMEYDCFRKKKTKEAATQEANAGTDLNENVIPHQATSVPGEKKHQEKEKVGGTGEGDEEEELTQEQLILLDMKNKPLDIKEGEKVLTVFAGTWNLHAKPPPNDLSLWLPKDKFDIVVIGTEECEKSIQASIVFSGKEKWTNTLTQHLGPSYLEITQSTLAATHIIAFCKQEVWPKISQIDQDDVATGIGDVIGNKGGVGLCFDVGQTSFLFINAHFHAHQGNVHQRNDDYKKINGKLRLRDKDLDELHSRHELEGVKQMGQGRGKLRNIVERFDRVVWMGDLNYRVNGNRKIIDALIGQEMFEVLRANDQLLHVMRDNQAFHGFQEGPLVFPPTYKFDAGTDTYDTSKKQRIPSWTDRVVYLPRREIQLREYDSVREIRTSDHRPVYASFDMCYLPVDSLGLKDKQSSRDGTSVCSIQ